MEDRLDGTTALVTGASSGIGLATAKALSHEGATVALVARRLDRLTALREEIADAGGSALVVEADITQREQAHTAVARVVAETGRLDTVVNNAGVMLNGWIVGAPIEEWERMVSLNVMGLLYVTHAALDHLLAAAQTPPRQVADLVNVSSMAGRVAILGAGVYNATKFGVCAFSESLRQEVAQRYLRVSLVEPGLTTSELISHQRDETQERYRRRFDGIEHMRAEDIADEIAHIVTRPRHMAVNEILVRPTQQA
jgi:NADP-dependent 3-hydroxy acid dehydrogenase YdfG